MHLRGAIRTSHLISSIRRPALHPRTPTHSSTMAAASSIDMPVAPREPYADHPCRTCKRIFGSMTQNGPLKWRRREGLQCVSCYAVRRLTSIIRE